LALQTGLKHVFSKFIKHLHFLTVEDGHDRAERNETTAYQTVARSPKDEKIITIPDAAGDSAGSDKRTLGGIELL
jgi:hypothetical protein